MQPKTPGLLHDIRDAARHILNRTRGETLDSYREDRDLRQVIERNFEIIGEAVRRLSYHDPETTRRITDYRDIIALRNVLAHDYRTIDSVRMWRAIEVSLPQLLVEVEGMLHEAEGTRP
jgi:uncharacterized protein with HEPN domain